MRTVTWAILSKRNAEALSDRITTDRGRESFWCESSRGASGVIEMTFPNGVQCHQEVILAARPRRFGLDYFDAATETGASSKT